MEEEPISETQMNILKEQHLQRNREDAKKSDRRKVNSSVKGVNFKNDFLFETSFIIGRG